MSGPIQRINLLNNIKMVPGDWYLVKVMVQSSYSECTEVERAMQYTMSDEDAYYANHKFSMSSKVSVVCRLARV